MKDKSVVESHEEGATAIASFFLFKTPASP